MDITDDPREWKPVSVAIWGGNKNLLQNRKEPAAFSNDGGKTYYLVTEKIDLRGNREMHKSKESDPTLF